MMKIALLTAALTAAGTAAYVTTTSSSASSKAPVATASLAAPAAAATAVAPAASALAAPAATGGSPSAAPAEGGAPCHACNGTAPDPDALPLIDDATLAKLRLHEGPSEGADKAPVTVVVFNDMQCHFCGETLGNLDQLLEDYPGKLRIVMKQMPVHKTAELAAEAALAAEAQGKFWELHDLMMAQQDDLSQGAILALAKQGGLDVAALRKALEQRTYADAVKKDMSTAIELGVTGTPAFIINGKRVAGHRPIEQMRKLVDEALARAGA
jgi:protein-disulfide isomerase